MTARTTSGQHYIALAKAQHNIAIVGARGFIGQHLIEALCAAPKIGPVNLKYIHRGDPMDFAGCDTVYHVAGVTGGSQFLSDDPLGMAGSNLRLALDVFDAAKRDGVRRVIAMSSTTGYSEHLPSPILEEEYFLGSVPNCYTNPGETRRFIERLGRMYPFDITFLRCAGAYGPGDDYEPATSHAIGATIRKVAERQDPIVCWGDGQDARDGTHVEDLARALVACMDLEGKQSINIGTGRTMTIKAMIDMLCRHAGYRPHVVYDRAKPQMIRSRLLDVGLARKLIGWEATTTMEDGLTTTLDWYEANQR